MKKKFNLITGKIFPVYVYYSVPSVLALLAMSSAIVIDGAFLGNYVGAEALAAVNFAMPIMSLIFGIGLMFSIGGSVKCGKYLGEKNFSAASTIFSNSVIVTALFSLLIMVSGFLFMKLVIILLGVGTTLAPLTSTYLYIIFMFTPFMMGSLILSYFVRVSGEPILASGVMVGSAVFNVLCDWLFIAFFNMGITGAALATGLSHLLTFTILALYFFIKKGDLTFIWSKKWWSGVLGAAYNGLSEFANEISAGVITFIFNWVMMRNLGVQGVAAFTIVNYLLFMGFMISYGISDALQPIISNNFGAKRPERILSFIKIASITVLIIGVVIIFLLLVIPASLVNVFIKSGETETLNIALKFISVFWPAFLFNGINIVLSSYFTAIHRPLPSAVISLLRSFLLPAILIGILPVFLGDIGIFIAIPCAEFITFFIALIFMYVNSPTKAISV